MITYEPLCGDSIEHTSRMMARIASRTRDRVQAWFNRTRIIALPRGGSQRIVSYYLSETHRRHEEYITSPRYKEACRKAEEEQRQKDLLLQGALSMAPDKMTFQNEPLWLECVEKNQDDYGAAVVQFADRWARIMETRIGNGEPIEDCADDACGLADMGITGFMYGCAVSILSRVWIHGDALRHWHNLKTQIGTEGERANESGGVLNPAILTIG